MSINAHENSVATSHFIQSRFVMGKLTKKFRTNLRAFMVERDLANTTVAKAAKMSESNIRALLKYPDRSPTLDTVESIAAGLKVSVAELLGLQQKELNEDLFLAILTILLRIHLDDDDAVERTAQVFLRAYKVGALADADPTNMRDLRLLHGS